MAHVTVPTIATIRHGLCRAVKLLTKRHVKHQEAAGLRVVHLLVRVQHQVQLLLQRLVALWVRILQIGRSIILLLTSTQLQMWRLLQAKLISSISVLCTSVPLLALPQCHTGARHLMVPVRIPLSSL